VPFLLNIQHLEICSLWSRDETWSLRNGDRDSQKWISRPVSRPKPRLENQSLMIIHICSLVLHQSYPVSNNSFDEKQE